MLLAIAAVPAQAAVTPPAAPDGCAPGIGIGLLQFPRERAQDPRARSYVLDHVAPGTTFTRRFQVCNGTGATATAELYAAAADVRDGSFQLADDRTANALSRSITVTPPTLTLAAGRAGSAEATFRIPRDAQEGEQYAVLYAELTGSGTGDLQTKSRAGIRVYLDVSAGGEKPSDFAVDSFQAVRQDDGSPAVRARVTNTGARALDLRGDLTLTDGPGGLSGGPFPAEVGTTLGVGQSGPVTIPLDDFIRGGPWLATLTLMSGTLERRAAGRVTFPDQVGQENAPVKAKNLPLREDPSVVIPVAAGLLGAALLLLLLLWRRRPEQQEGDPERDPRLLEPAG